MNKHPISVLCVNNQDGGAEPRMTWLDLPATQAGLERAMLRIGLVAVPSHSKEIEFPDAAGANARIIRYKTSLDGLDGHLIRHPDISHLNRLAECLESMNRAALRRFTLFLHTERANSFEAILLYAEHLTTGRGRRRQAPAPGR